MLLAQADISQAVSSRAYWNKGIWFEPSVDHLLFHAESRSTSGTPVRVFFYGRPSTDRNAFEIGIEALRKIKQKFGPAVEIVSAGESWDPAWFSLEGVVANLGVFSYDETPALYRGVDVGLCFMMTRHPSYLPLEMMACGVTVVTNNNHSNRWLFKHGENVLLAEPMVSSIAEQLSAAIEDKALRQRIGSTAAQRMASTTWDEQAEKTFKRLAAALGDKTGA